MGVFIEVNHRNQNGVKFSARCVGLDLTHVLIIAHIVAPQPTTPNKRH